MIARRCVRRDARRDVRRDVETLHCNVSTQRRAQPTGATDGRNRRAQPTGATDGRNDERNDGRNRQASHTHITHGIKSQNILIRPVHHFPQRERQTNQYQSSNTGHADKHHKKFIQIGDLTT